jgi:fatty acid desaturase
MARKDPDPVRITSATRSHSDDIGARQRRYLISMAIRTACFIAAVLVFVTTGQGWVMWVLIIASFILPYVAVVMANAGASPDPGGPDPFGPDPSRKEIEPPPEN